MAIEFPPLEALAEIVVVSLRLRILKLELNSSKVVWFANRDSSVVSTTSKKTTFEYLLDLYLQIDPLKID